MDRLSPSRLREAANRVPVDEPPPDSRDDKDGRNRERHHRSPRERFEAEQARESDAAEHGDSEGGPGLESQPGDWVDHVVAWLLWGEKQVLGCLGRFQQLEVCFCFANVGVQAFLAQHWQGFCEMVASS